MNIKTSTSRKCTTSDNRIIRMKEDVTHEYLLSVASMYNVNYQLVFDIFIGAVLLGLRFGTSQFDDAMCNEIEVLVFLGS